MAAPCCPTCGRNLPKPRAVQVRPVNLEELTTAELYAHHKRQAPIEDLAFLQRYGERLMSPELWDRIEACRNPTTKDVASLRTLWRIERQNADRAAGVPSIGSPAWREALEPVETDELTQIAS